MLLVGPFHFHNDSVSRILDVWCQQCGEYP